MALIIADRVKETTITQGTGTITLSGSTFGGFQSFSDAIGEGNSTYYCIQNESNFEIGIGTFSSGSLSRDTVLESSNSDAKISIVGTAVVFCVIPSQKLIFKDENDNVTLPQDLTIDDLSADYISAASGDFSGPLTSNSFSSSLVSANDIIATDSLNSSGLLTLRRESAGNFFHAYIDDLNDRTISLYSDGLTPTWRLGLKSSPSSETEAPSYGYIYASDGEFGIVGNMNNKVTMSNATPFCVQHQGQNIIQAHYLTGVHLDSMTSAFPALVVNGGISLSANIQEWDTYDGTTLSVVDNQGFFGIRNDNPSYQLDVTGTGSFSQAVRFGDGTLQTTAGIPYASGSLIDQNAADIITQSGYFQDYIDGLDHSATAVSGWAESYIDQTSGNLQVQIDINESNISTVSGLIGDADFLPGASGGLIDQNSQDILTVSGLVYDGSAVSGYFESRVDSADSAINTVSGLLTPSGESFNFAGNLLTYNNSDGGSFTADLSSLSTFDTSGVSLAYSAGTLTYTNNAGGSFDVDISSISGDVYALIVDGAPTTLDTLNEIAAALNDDENIANTLTTLISTTSGNLQSQITSNDGDITQLNSDITTVSGLLYDDAAISGYFESRVDQADADIVTVSGLLYDDAAISGYFESRVDQADADIVTVSGLLYDDSAVSGYFESRVDQADSDIATVSGLLDSVTPTGTPSGVGFFDNAGSLSGNSSFTYDGANVRLFGNIDVSGISTFGSGIKTYLRTEADATTITFDMDQSNNYTAELGGNRTLAVSNVDAGQKFTIRLTQDATGSREPTWWSGITWLTSDGSEPTLKTGSGEIDYFGFISTSGGYYEGFHLTEAGGGGGGGSSTITVKEADGTPNVSNVSTIVVSNGTLTNDGGGQVTITTGGGGGGSYDDTYISGVSTFASGLAIQNQADIATVSGLLYDDTAISGYFESRVDQADSDITTVSGLIPPNTFDITGGDGTNYTIDAMGLNSASDPTMYLHKGHTYIFNKTFSGHPFRISDTDGGSVYQDADGNNIEIGSSAGAVTFEVPQDAPDKLYYYCTAHPSTMKGVIYTTADGATSGYFESRVDANQAAITSNDADIAYLSGIAVYGSGHTLQTVTDNGASTTNAVTITNNNITASSGLFDSLDMTPLVNGSQPAYQEGVVFYDSENHTLSLYNDEADVTLQLGQEEFLRVRNNTGATIPNGAAVLINGSHGNAAPTISGAIATSEANSQIVGLTTHSIETDSFGYVTTYGIVRDVDTSAFSAGDEVFLSATQIGSGTNVAPIIPNFKVNLGHVINSASSNGSILVQVGQPKLGGGDMKSEAPLNLSGIPFVTQIADTTAGGSQTDSLFIFDSGNRQLQLGSGLQLLDGVPSNTSNVLYNDAGTLKFNGSAIGGGGGGGTTYTAGSGLSLVGSEFNVYGGSGNFEHVELSTNNNVVPTFKFLGSGVTDTPINLEVRSSLQSATGSGTALLFQGTQGQLFSITDNLSSGTIFNVSDITGLPMLEVTASGDVEIGEFADNITIHQPVLLSGGVPTDTTNKLYNDAGTLKFNGSAIGGGSSYNDVPLSGYFESRVDQNAADIITVSGLTGGGSSYTAGSGLTLAGTEFNVYGGSGNFENIDLTTDGTTVPKMVFTGSGVTDTPIRMKVLSSHASASTSGTALSFEGTEGQLFGITDNLSSGRIFSVNDITGLPLISVDASGDVELAEFGRDIIAHKPITLQSGVPSVTTNKLYNDGYGLYFNGSAVGGGGSSYNDVPLSGYFESRVDQADADIISSSGYFEDNILELVGVSGIDITSAGSTVNISAGSLSGYFESRVDSADTNISTNSSSITANSGYFESRVDTNAADIVVVSGLTGGGGAVSAVANGANNRVATFSSADALNGEANLTFDGSTLAVNGAFTATTKSFLIDHPSKPGMKLRYGSLEGPENGVYVRGTTIYEKIILPDYWKDLIDERTITVTLTPLHEFQSLFVKNKNCCEIEVGGCSGEYDYVVYGERKDVDKLEVEW